MRHIYSTYKEHYKALIFLGLPIVIGQIGVIVLGFADTLMIGHHSTIELGAASFVNNVFNLAIIFSTGFSYGLTPYRTRVFECQYSLYGFPVWHFLFLLGLSAPR